MYIVGTRPLSNLIYKYFLSLYELSFYFHDDIVFAAQKYLVLIKFNLTSFFLGLVTVP